VASPPRAATASHAATARLNAIELMFEYYRAEPTAKRAKLGSPIPVDEFGIVSGAGHRSS
jgi:hypothetical protein